MARAQGGRHRFHLVVQVLGRVEDHPGRGQAGVPAQLADEFVAVHHGHDQIGDDEIGALRPGDQQGLCPVAGFEYGVAEEPSSVTARSWWVG